MIRYLQMKKVVIFSSVILLSFCLIIGERLLNAVTYTESAHSNSSYGVNRSSLSSFNYAKGNCAHCHEQHASIGGTEPDPASGSASEWLLFRNIYIDQSSGFCFGCHQDSSTQINMPTQYCYSYRWGGDTSLTCPNSIEDAFIFIVEGGAHNPNCGSSTGSSHQLTLIRNFIMNKWEFDNSNINPCSGCHNPHKAQRASYPV
ncbi:MAG: hypothetical protein SVW57_12800, partial [Thermodesulfobacteriota bacterium]|nr:hypothetical protein [Thermodesulfobacteriota bacterium]